MGLVKLDSKVKEEALACVEHLFLLDEIDDESYLCLRKLLLLVLKEDNSINLGDGLKIAIIDTNE